MFSRNKQKISYIYTEIETGDKNQTFVNYKSNVIFVKKFRKMESPQLIGGFKQKFEQFIELYYKTKADNQSLKLEVEWLKKKIEEREIEIEALKKQQETKQLAETFLVGSGDTQEARLKINKIVREIDNCIALLNR